MRALHYFFDISRKEMKKKKKKTCFSFNFCQFVVLKNSVDELKRLKRENIIVLNF